MKKTFLTFVAVASLASPVLAADMAQKPEDAIKAIATKVDAALSKHDTKALIELFADDATFIAPMGDGKLVKGKADIQKAHEMMFNSPGWKNATAKHTVQNIRMIGTDTALVDLMAEFPGMKMDGMPAGAPMPTFHATVLTKNIGGKWLIEDVRPYSIMPMPAAAKPM